MEWGGAQVAVKVLRNLELEDIIMAEVDYHKISAYIYYEEGCFFIFDIFTLNLNAARGMIKLVSQLVFGYYIETSINFLQHRFLDVIIF